VWARPRRCFAHLLFLKRTNTGRAVRACSINLQAARLMASMPRGSRCWCSQSPATGALAGIVITPIVLANWTRSCYGIKGFIGAILGGMRSPAIAVAGGLGIGIIESFAAGYISSGYKDAIVYGVLIAYLLLRGGVFLFGRRALSSHEP